MTTERKIKLILGSSSLARKKVLAEAGFVFETMSPDIDEKAIRSDNFNELVLTIGQAKMDALLANNTFAPDTIIITSDFVTSCNGKLREKPISPEEARMWHQEYSNGEALCHCSVVVHHVGLNKTLKEVTNASILWEEIPERVIEEIVADPYTYEVAGFTNEAFFHYTKRIDGAIDTVLGLPLRNLRKFLEELGYYN